MNWGLNSIRGKRFFSSFKMQTGSGTHPFFCSVGTGAVLWVRWLGSEFSHLHASGSKMSAVVQPLPCMPSLCVCVDSLYLCSVCVEILV